MTITSGIRKGLKKILEHGGGGEEGKPHSTSAGRMAAGARKFRRGAKKIASGAIEGTKKIAKPFVKEAVGLEKLRKKKAEGGRAGYQSGGRTRLLEELGRVEAEPSNRNRRAEISRVHGELNRGYKGGGRAKHGLGSIVKKVITKIKPKPKPGAVKDVNVDKLLKNLGDEIKAAPLPPQLKKSLDKLKKAYPHKKASGGRIGLKHGSAQSHYMQHGYGPHKIQLRSGKPKIAKKGW